MEITPSPHAYSGKVIDLHEMDQIRYPREQVEQGAIPHLHRPRYRFMAESSINKRFALRSGSLSTSFV